MNRRNSRDSSLTRRSDPPKFRSSYCRSAEALPLPGVRHCLADISKGKISADRSSWAWPGERCSEVPS